MTPGSVGNSPSSRLPPPCAVIAAAPDPADPLGPPASVTVPAVSARSRSGSLWRFVPSCGKRRRQLAVDLIDRRLERVRVDAPLEERQVVVARPFRLLGHLLHELVGALRARGFGQVRRDDLLRGFVVHPDASTEVEVVELHLLAGAGRRGRRIPRALPGLDRPVGRLPLAPGVALNPADADHGDSVVRRLPDVDRRLHAPAELLAQPCVGGVLPSAYLEALEQLRIELGELVGPVDCALQVQLVKLRLPAPSQQLAVSAQESEPLVERQRAVAEHGLPWPAAAWGELHALAGRGVADRRVAVLLSGWQLEVPRPDRIPHSGLALRFVEHRHATRRGREQDAGREAPGRLEPRRRRRCDRRGVDRHAASGLDVTHDRRWIGRETGFDAGRRRRLRRWARHARRRPLSDPRHRKGRRRRGLDHDAAAGRRQTGPPLSSPRHRPPGRAEECGSPPGSACSPVGRLPARTEIRPASAEPASAGPRSIVKSGTVTCGIAVSMPAIRETNWSPSISVSVTYPFSFSTSRACLSRRCTGLTASLSCRAAGRARSASCRAAGRSSLGDVANIHRKVRD